MKKITKVLTGLVASLTLFGGLFFLNNLDNKNNELPNEEFNEVIGENAFFNDYGKSIDLTPKKAIDSDTLLDPIIKVQISNLQSDNKRSIRFVAAIPDLNVSAKFIRTMYDEEGNEFKGRKEYEVSEAYTSIISGDSVVTPDSFGEGYN